VLFRRGDVNFDLRVNLTDAVLSLNVLFIGAERFPCADAADVNDSGGINLTDALHLLNYSFLGGPPPPAPGPRSCGVDPTNDVLGECEAACR
jgi:hypothetical protein